MHPVLLGLALALVVGGVLAAATELWAIRYQRGERAALHHHEGDRHG